MPHATRTALACLLLLLAVPGRAAGAALDRNGYWAGATDTAHAATRVTGEFTVPKIADTCGTTADVAVWVGLGGWDTNRFAQLGVTLTHGSMGAWYELFDQDNHGPLVPFDYALKPGDRIRIRLAFSDDHSTLTLVWNDLTSGNRVVKPISDAARYWSGDTAEWIVERHQPRFADFGQLTFQRAYYTDDTGLHTALPADYRSVIVNSAAKPLTSTTFGDDGATTRWLACR